MEKTLKPHFFVNGKINNSLSYAEYFELFKEKAEKIIDVELNNDEISQLNLTKLNFQRSSRINKTYTVSADFCEKIKSINKPQIWMLITEDWCGDSAQNIPHIVKMAECNSLIDLEIVLRDTNLDIIDNYLTNGVSRSIPKFVAFDLDGNELFQWGPRPQEAQEVVNAAKASGKPKEEFLNELHLWYARNKGKALENEFNELIEKLAVTVQN